MTSVHHPGCGISAHYPLPTALGEAIPESLDPEDSGFAVLWVLLAGVRLLP